MPEGPEIRRAADQIEKAVKQKTILEVSFAFEHLQDYEPLFAGEKVLKVETVGKAMLMRFSNGYTIYSHNQLYGKWVIRNAYNYPKTNRQLRLAVHTEKKSALLYSASDIEVLKDEEVHLHPFIAKAGPDLLNQKVSAKDLITRMKDKRFAGRRWTALLLDQAFVAGNGNYLRSEILFKAGIHPSLRPKDCRENQLRLAAEAILQLTKQSYETGGITNDLELANKLKAQGQKRSAYRHWVFARAGQSCRIDGTPIEKIIAGSRRLYFCPTCQAIERDHL
ncbi:endonuclease VIII [Jeotgalibacillus aurantiacus]|uniref:endonuclease VIII n=1 Tax=Jeotgalibacillus aurantiacus TaxID=2763266 RepID=UPI001D0B04B0|nr:endonuclease VIII [Jeotgalibacillus aurantiacus]